MMPPLLHSRATPEESVENPGVRRASIAAGRQECPAVQRLENRVIIVTGAGRGIGAATAARLVAEGARVHGFDLVAPDPATQGWSGASRVDVADPDQCRTAVAAVVELEGRLDGLVNCAGVGIMRRTEEHEWDEWRRVLAVNLDGTFAMCRAAIGALLESQGAIVNMASVAGRRGQPYNAAYCASKGGVISLTEALGIEYQRRGVRVNCVAPGGVDTDFAATMGFSRDLDWDLMGTTVMRITDMVDPQEIAAAIAYLLSDDAASITAQTLVIDKGLTKM
jgi:NAD(P)-dependent dehydrogenase (short-subunit alcohol dehydrogenase family)